MKQTTTIHPSRVGCPSLPGTMKGIVMSIPGVSEVKVHYEERSLDVTYEDSQVSPSDIVKKIGEELGLAMEAGKPDGSKEENADETCTTC